MFHNRMDFNSQLEDQVLLKLMKMSTWLIYCNFSHNNIHTSLIEPWMADITYWCQDSEIG